jgi:hypothetical protein
MSQKPTTGPYVKPAQSSLDPTSPRLNLILSSHPCSFLNKITFAFHAPLLLLHVHLFIQNYLPGNIFISVHETQVWS